MSSSGEFRDSDNLMDKIVIPEFSVRLMEKDFDETENFLVKSDVDWVSPPNFSLGSVFIDNDSFVESVQNGCVDFALAGDPSGSGGLQHSSAEGLVRDVPFSFFSESPVPIHVHPHEESNGYADLPLNSHSDVYLSRDHDSTPPCYCFESAALLRGVEASSDISCKPRGYVRFQDGGQGMCQVDSVSSISPQAYFFEHLPVFVLQNWFKKFPLTLILLLFRTR